MPKQSTRETMPKQYWTNRIRIRWAYDDAMPKIVFDMWTPEEATSTVAYCAKDTLLLLSTDVFFNSTIKAPCMNICTVGLNSQQELISLTDCR